MAQEISDDAEYAMGYLKIWTDQSHPGNEFSQWFLVQWREAHRRMYALTDDERLRWLLDFTRLKIEALSHEAQLILAFDLHQFLCVRPIGKPVPIPAGVPREPELLDIQRHVAQGLRAIMAEDHKDTDLSTGWILPPIDRRVVRVSALGYVETTLNILYSPDNIVSMLVNAIADFVVRAGQRLRVCANCRTLFVANKRQAYCTPACSQTKRTQRKRARMLPASTDEQHWYTRQKPRKKVAG
jgi:hypothetical protein